MSPDVYLRGVLTVIAGALVYLSVVLTPVPAVSAQGALRPGDPTGPAEMVIVGVRLSQGGALPVQVQAPIAVTGEVRVAGDVRINGRVQTEQVPRTTQRVVLAGWEESGTTTAPGRFLPWDQPSNQALPVAPRPPR
jgi:hypothetical protein